MRYPPRFILFPYTTLFRSHGFVDVVDGIGAAAVGPGWIERVDFDDGNGSDGAFSPAVVADVGRVADVHAPVRPEPGGHGLADRKSTRLNSSHQIISYAVFC